MAAQGQAVFAGAGDNGAYDLGGTFLQVIEPGSQPYVTAVGISILNTNPDGSYSSETAAAPGGGGVSGIFTIPSYQTPAASQAVGAAMVSTTMRNVPDVVLLADSPDAYGYAVYVNGTWRGGYGSSLSAPVWASFISLVNQGLGQNGPLGFANPALYRIAQGSRYADDFHDITTGNNNYYPAEPRFDDATGLGSFNGLNLYNDLIGNFTGATPPAAPSELNATASVGQVSLSWSASSGALSYSIKRSTANGGPYTTIANAISYTTYIDAPMVTLVPTTPRTFGM
jgi:kumamolisin